MNNKENNNKILDWLVHKIYNKKFNEIINYHDDIWYLTSKKVFSLDELGIYNIIIWICYQELWNLKEANIFFDLYLNNLELSDSDIIKINKDKETKFDKESLKFMFLMNNISELGFTYKVNKKDYDNYHKKEENKLKNIKKFLLKYNMINIIVLTNIILLIIAFFDNPYWYYQFMRIFLFWSSLYLILTINSNNNLKFLWERYIKNFTIFFWVIAVVYPIFHLWRDFWEIVNVITIIWYWIFLESINKK